MGNCAICKVKKPYNTVLEDKIIVCKECFEVWTLFRCYGHFLDKIPTFTELYHTLFFSYFHQQIFKDKKRKREDKEKYRKEQVKRDEERFLEEQEYYMGLM
jgi:hypothetical protein